MCRYILIYPHGCDVCNHLSLFLCVADYDKLLPGWGEGLFLLEWWECVILGWSHFAQFTIAVVNKDPKKSKYSGRSHSLIPQFKLECRYIASFLQEGA